MNELQTTQQEAKQASQQLITINPTEYVAAVYAPFHDRASQAIEADAGVTYDIRTVAGLDVAKKARATFRAIRVEAEGERKARKAPILEIGKLLDSSYKGLEASIAPFEERHDAAIKEREREQEEERQRKAAAELARVTGIQQRIADINKATLKSVGMTSAEVSGLVAELETMEIGEDFEELRGVALVARDDAVATLKGIFEVKAAAEADAARRAEEARIVEEAAQRERERLAAERAEHDRVVAAQQAAAREEEERLASERKRMEEQAAAVAAEQAEQQRQMDEQRAQIERERAALVAAEVASNPPITTEVAADAVTAHRMMADPVPEFIDAISDATPAVVRPEYKEFVEGVADHFGVTEAVAVDWINFHAKV